MKTLLSIWCMRLLLPSGTKKLFMPRNSSSVAVDPNKFEVEGDASGSPWVV